MYSKTQKSTCSVFGPQTPRTPIPLPKIGSIFVSCPDTTARAEGGGWATFSMLVCLDIWIAIWVNVLTSGSCKKVCSLGLCKRGYGEHGFHPRRCHCGHMLRIFEQSWWECGTTGEKGLASVGSTSTKTLVITMVLDINKCCCYATETDCMVK